MAHNYLGEVRRTSSTTRQELVDKLAPVADLIAKGACVYATGSYGRSEAGPQSDLDCFMLVKEIAVADSDKMKAALDRIDEIKIQYHLIRAAEDLDLPKFDGGGKYLETHSPRDLVEHLGSQEDDYRNLFTARLLLILESKCLAGQKVYDDTINEVIEKYFKDYAGHEDSFRPSYLLNDIIRMWRTFCVNYEHNRKEESRQKIKNLKLKFCRMITCYSGVIFIAATFAKNGTVSPYDIRSMVDITPTERLEYIASDGFWADSDKPEGLELAITQALELYDDFLQLTHAGTRQAVKLFQEDEKKWHQDSYAFGEALSKAIDCIGYSSENGARIRRIIVI